MARLLAIDYGGKRTGLAVTDPSKIIVSPLQTVDTTVLTPFLKDYLNKNKVEKVIVGYPENPDGDRENPIVKQIILFTDNLKRLFPGIYFKNSGFGYGFGRFFKEIPSDQGQYRQNGCCIDSARLDRRKRC